MIAVVIPAFEPPQSLVALVAALAAEQRVAHIVLVDDGSSGVCRGLFQDLAAMPRTTVLRHARNRGKGAALKSAFDYLQCHVDRVTTVVTVDADGQHLRDDIVRVAAAALESPGSLVLGVRVVGSTAPLRSRAGNTFTRHLYSALVGQQLHDTQTGLRAVPRALLPALISISGTGYEYELNVLIHCRQAHVDVIEVPIAAVYLDGNRRSHFRPVRDSWRVCTVLFRFGAVSLMSALLDNLMFVMALTAGASQASALGLARLVSAGFNYPLVKGWVFTEATRNVPTFGPYVALLILNVIAAHLGTLGFRQLAGLSPLASKILWEILFFLPNYLLQRDVVFRSPRATMTLVTDWTSYYASVPLTARLTRRYTASRLVAALRMATAASGPLRTIAELGGAASCFVDRVCQALGPDTYVVVDSNQFGLSKLEAWRPPAGTHTALELVASDVRSFGHRELVDTAFSVGLIEHFGPTGTRDVLRAHFALVRRGGAVVVSYPTPTWLYRATRRVLESLRLWRFPDERPLRFDEIERAATGHGAVIHRQILWPLMLTHEMVVFVKQ